MRKSNPVGFIVLVVGLLLILYESYWLYSGYYLQSNLGSLCTIANPANQNGYTVQCSYGAIALKMNSIIPINSVPTQLFPSMIGSIDAPHEWMLGLGIVIFIAGLVLKLRR